MEKYFYQSDGAEIGPCTLNELRFLALRGKIDAATLLRQENAATWHPAEGVGDLFSATQSPLPTVPSGPMFMSRTAIVRNSEPTPVAPATPPLRNTAKPTADFAPQRRVGTNSQADYRAPSATLVVGEDPDEQFRRRTIQAAIIGALLILLLLLLLWMFLGGGLLAGAGGEHGTGGGSGRGEGTGVGTGSGDGTGSGSGGGRGSGSGGGQGDGHGDGQGNGSDAGASKSPVPSGTSASQPNRPPIPKPVPLATGIVMGPPTPISTVPPPLPVGPPSSPSEFGTGSGGGGGGGGGSEFLGVRVKGKIALVCDVSGSMSSDFPILVKELRKKFPKDTPLILVGGCHFGPAMPPSTATKINGRNNYMPPEFANDPHVYNCSNTTDAIIYAVEELKRNTVMFNSDLQDGGSERAIEDLEQLRKKHKFTLSGRSLNCDAPERLLEFIKASGGDFKVDTLSRQKMPAVPWSR